MAHKTLHIKIKKLHPDIKTPTRATDGSSGYDIYMDIDRVGIVPHDPDLVIFKTGLCFDIPKGYEGQIRIRSSMSRKGWNLANGVGTIDSDYRGEVAILLRGPKKLNSFYNYPRIAQIVFAPVCSAEFEIVEELETTERGCGGFGSTGE